MINLPIEEVKKIKTRINKFCENKINAFSPTISPAPKSFTRNEIESIEEGIHYYIKRGVTSLVFQKKYMGSYCDIYLHKNVEESYLASRNGHLINYIDNEKVVLELQKLHQKFDWNKTKIIIIQSELLPWHVLGKGLIQNEFFGYLNAHENHFNELKNNNLYNKINKVRESESYLNFKKDKIDLSEKELKNKYESHVLRQYNAIEGFVIKDLKVYEKSISIYKEQIVFFGKEAELYFKPFNILKKIFDDETEEIVNDNNSYSIVNEDEFMTLEISENTNLEVEIEKIYDWFNQLTSKNEEGIVIKPKTSFINGVAPALKVRNNNYLTMIYGLDFLENFKQNFGKRKIERKLDCSINDWMQNWELLKVKHQDISNENYYFKNLVLDRILGESIENQLDSRL